MTARAPRPWALALVAGAVLAAALTGQPAQAAVPVLADDTEETLAARILRQEHRLYPLVVRCPIFEDNFESGNLCAWSNIACT